MGVELDWLRHWWGYESNALDVDPGVRVQRRGPARLLGSARSWNGVD